VKLDFTDAVITQPTLQIQAYVRGSGLVLVTKPGIKVDTDGNCAWRNGQNPAAEWLERAGTAHSAGLDE
jgi:hypothetical protein